MTEENFVCPFCGREYKTKLGLSKHLKVCEAKPDEEEKGEKEDPEESGIPLFEEEDEYVCPECDYTAKNPFAKCPNCGEALEW
jgi:rubrerythrin